MYLLHERSELTNHSLIQINITITDQTVDMENTTADTATATIMSILDKLDIIMFSEDSLSPSIVLYLATNKTSWINAMKIFWKTIFFSFESTKTNRIMY